METISYHLITVLNFDLLQPDTLTLVLEYSNIIFSALFALEMLMKLVAEGPFAYIKNGFNVFDGFIVILR